MLKCLNPYTRKTFSSLDDWGNKRTGRYAPCPLDLCRSIGLRFTFLALWASTRPAALISACGLNFRPAVSIFDLSGFNSACGLDLGLRPQFSKLWASTWSRLPSSIMGALLCVAVLWIRHHCEDVYMTSQPIAAHSSAAA